MPETKYSPMQGGVEYEAYCVCPTTKHIPQWYQNADNIQPDILGGVTVEQPNGRVDRAALGDYILFNEKTGFFAVLSEIAFKRCFKPVTAQQDSQSKALQALLGTSRPIDEIAFILGEVEGLVSKCYDNEELGVHIYELWEKIEAGTWR